ncbi:L-lysine 2,3-aminomutase [Agrobacterium sp. DSM 25558]|uniref:KamA family radical SAM protein n=1 Tax=Agrobacterium sp. DSM 25558 TaxID=1907665 RepID=UPI0009724503|nr:KamA family radical SAM protein [Agrobacterium sp. DSM 25558]SCX22985.1 L-lysine 2,3-aminomutase [Agrobacterium sp. DSM 25558]
MLKSGIDLLTSNIDSTPPPPQILLNEHQFTPSWRDLRRDEFWRQISIWRDLSEETFLDTLWQEKNAVTSREKLSILVGDLVGPTFLEDLAQGMSRAPMALRVSPYILSLIDWSTPLTDPLRRQFLPLGSELEDDHPLLQFDSLGEQNDSPVPGLTHRYPTKALFLPITSCPVYCRFCTRSYAVGTDTDQVVKVHLSVDRERWKAAFDYIAKQPELEDIVISGGDAFRLKPEQLRIIGHALLDMPHVRRIRFATKGLAVQPMKILRDVAWVSALTEVAERGRRLHKEVCIHTHFNHPSEVTGITEDASALLFERGIPIRNQAVLLRDVNDDVGSMIELGRRLGALNIHPYYVYLGDLVKGTEDLRTTISKGITMEKAVRGSTAGFNTPTFVVDTPGGGGKRDVHSFEYYDPEYGIAVYTAPSVRRGKLFISVDPLRDLQPAVQQVWRDAPARAELLSSILQKVGSPG